MTEKQLENLKIWFADYVKGYYTGDIFNDTNIGMKQEHTDYVCQAARYLAKELDLSPNDSLIAETLAILHDVGRFEQFKVYKTYKDSDSINHSCLGVKIIQQQKLLDAFDSTEKQIILNAIRYHGEKSIPDNLDEKSTFFTKIIRDADKIDIYRVLIGKYKQYKQDPNSVNLELEFSTDPSLTPAVIDSVLSNKLCDYTLLKTENDVKILILGWVCDMNFAPTLKFIQKQGYFETVIGYLPENPTTTKIASHIRNYIKSRLDTDDSHP
jgi:HD superfamily phosphohydrolase YqeK